MLDLLLENQPEFLEKFREYSKECFVLKDIVADFMMTNEIPQKSLDDEIITAKTFQTRCGGNDFELTFSDNLNIIIGKNIESKKDNTLKAQILFNNKVGSTKMNCHITDYQENSFPVNFTLEGIGTVEHFFLNEDNSKIHEMKFGTWCFPSESEIAENKILNLFPAILQKNLPSIEIEFSQEKENIIIHFKYNSGKLRDGEFDNEDFEIGLKINKKKSEIFISAYKYTDELKSLIREDVKDTMQKMLFDSISEWLSQEVNLGEILEKTDCDQVQITYLNLSKKTPKIHPTEKEIQEIEKCDEGESRIVSRPMVHLLQKENSRNIKNCSRQDWIR